MAHDTGPRRRRSCPNRSGGRSGDRATGQATSIRIDPRGPASREFGKTLRGKIDPIALGIAVRDVRAETLAASRGATNFGEYFTYFSFFLVVSALMLAALFFKLGVEQRIREVGLLRAVGFSTPAVRRLFSSEGSPARRGRQRDRPARRRSPMRQLLMTGLRTWWLDAVGTTALTLHVTPLSLAAGALGGIVAAVVVHLVDAPRAQRSVGASVAGRRDRRRCEIYEFRNSKLRNAVRRNWTRIRKFQIPNS